MNFVFSTNFRETSVVADNVIENSTLEVLVKGLVFIYLMMTLAEFIGANTVL